MKFEAEGINMTALREDLLCFQHCHVDAQRSQLLLLQVWDALVAQCLSTSAQWDPLSLEHW